MIDRLVREALSAAGVSGVSTVAVVSLLSLALYLHKASRVGGLAVTAGSRLTHDIKILAVVLGVLLLLGVASVDVGRASEIAQSLRSVDYARLAGRLGRLLGL